MYNKIVTVNISLQTSAVSRTGFGIPIFVTDHVWFPERVRSYVDLEGVAGDVPTDSDAYIGARAAFSQDIPPAMVKLGRREIDDITFTPELVSSAGQVFELTVVGTDAIPVTVSFVTTTGSETADEITAALQGELEVLGVSAVTGVTSVDNIGTLTLSKSGVDTFYITDVGRLIHTTTSTESAADILEAITIVDNDWYFIATNDHSSAFVQAMAADIEARTKLYFVSLQDVANLAVYSDVATDTMSVLRQDQNFRTSAWYHDDADTAFLEMEYIAVAAPSDAGKKIWANNRTSSSAAKNASTGNPLSTTEKNNLVGKNANFTETVGGIVVTRRGQVSAGEWIDVIRNRDFLEARITEAYQNFLINEPVVPYTRSGILAVQNILESTLGRYVEAEGQPNILQADNPFKIRFPDRPDVSFGDVAARTFKGDFVAYLSGAIQVIKITGSLTYDAKS